MRYNDGHGHGYGRPKERRPISRKHGSKEELRDLLHSIDHRSYPAYKDLTGSFDFGDYELSIDHVQGDPFAAPSSVSVHIAGKTAGFPEEYYQEGPAEKRIALQDHLIRKFHKAIDKYNHKAGGSGKSGLVSCSNPGQEILDRSACQVDPKTGGLVFRLSVGFPAAGRTVLAGELEKILFHYLPECVRSSLLYKNLDKDQVKDVIDLAEDQAALRQKMKEMGLIAFLANGSILPRESGISQRPMKGAIRFASPKEDEVEIELPHAGTIAGMGIPKGITLIIGGGYHGKSTLLQALERGVYDHIDSDGREFVMTDRTAVKIRAEDGRCVMKDDISMFIRNLPNGKDTRCFSTIDASGSTSQAASVAEALESGSKVLLMDEDTCATNFMVRDDLMQRIVSPEEEPIIPYSQTMRPLLEEKGVSTILVAGSSGAFFQVSDRIIQMDQYVPKDVTERVRKILEEEQDGQTRSSNICEMQTGQEGQQTQIGQAEQAGSNHPKDMDGHDLQKGLDNPSHSNGPSGKKRNDSYTASYPKRCPAAGSEFAGRNGKVKMKNLGRDGFMIGHGTVDMRCVEQLTDGEQTECLASLLVLASGDMDGKTPVQKLVEKRWKEISEKGIAGCVSGRVPGNLAMPRKQEFYAAINRCRMLKM